MRQNSKSSLKLVASGLLASAIAVSAFSIAPTSNNLISFPVANAEAVRVDAPRAPGFADVVEAVSPAVVSVRVEQAIQPASHQGGFEFDRRQFGNDNQIPKFFRDNPDIFKRFFGDENRKHSKKRRNHGKRFGASQGSGFFISEDGYLVTNNHVIEGGTKYTIVMHDGSELEAKLIGADERSDLAVLKVEDSQEFTYVSFSNNDPRIGDWVVAVGNPFGLGGTVTAGIISARGREIGASRYDDFIQIDAAVNKGNSGGPAFDLNGEVIGVNTAIFSPSGGNVGIAFAIPASTSQEIVDELISNGSVVRGWLGVQIQPVTSDIADALDLDKATGAMVTQPQEDSPASNAGIQSGDIITKVDGKKVKGPKALSRLIADYEPNSEVELTVYRNGEYQTLSVVLGNLDKVASLNKVDEPESSKSETKLGLALAPSPEGEGVLVVEVEPESSADKKGIEPGDIIASVNGEEVSTPEEATEIISSIKKAGRKSTLLQIKRNDSSRFVALPFEKG